MPEPTTPRPVRAGDLDVTLSEPAGPAAVLSVRGEIDTLTAPQLAAGLAELFGCPADRLVLDLSEVTFLASSGLAVLIRSAQRAADRGSRLGLVVVTRAVRRPLEITGSDELFDLFEDLAAARAGRV